ncbi:hypothetical protein PRIPAC_79697 [Pristionchus pacificus]|nr:hypothetical protein PRIPAC_79697 [Pristionchus pacificus]
MDKMWDLGVEYMKGGQIEKAAVLFLRYVSVNVEILPNHDLYPHLEWDIRNKINEKANEGMEHTTKIRVCLGRLYEEEAMRLFNDIIEKSKFGEEVLKKHKDGQTSFLAMVNEVRSLEQQEIELNGQMLKMMNRHWKVNKTLAIPSDILDKYNSVVGKEDIVGVLLGKNPHTHYFVVSHLLIPGKQHTGANAEKFVHKVVEAATSEGLMPLGLIHSCDDKFVCQRLKCRPAPTVATDGNAPPSITYPPPPIDHHNQYSACHHLFAQHLYQLINPTSVTFIANPKAENQCVWLTPAGQITAARRSLYNGEVTGKAEHVQMSDAIHTIIVDLRGKEMEMKIENPVRRVTVKDRKENMMDTRENNENSEN